MDVLDWGSVGRFVGQARELPLEPNKRQLEKWANLCGLVRAVWMAL